MSLATIDWILTSKCNLSCYYCLMGQNRAINVTPIDYGFVEQLEEIYLFNLTGGEPFIVPNFIDVCATLERYNQLISINTNLTHNVKTFVEKISPDKVAFLNCSVHYPLRKEYMPPFIRQINKLKQAGFYPVASLVMIPELFDEIYAFWETYSQDIEILPKVMRGKSNNKYFPRDYTEDQKNIIQEMILASGRKLDKTDPWRFEILHTSCVSMDDWRFGRILDANEICVDGNTMIRITETGDIIYCKDKLVGNVYESGLKFVENRLPCPFSVENNGRCMCNM